MEILDSTLLDGGCYPGATGRRILRPGTLLAAGTSSHIFSYCNYSKLCLSFVNSERHLSDKIQNINNGGCASHAL